MGCVRVRTHWGVIIIGRWSTSWRVISQEMPAVADDDAGTQHGHRHARPAQQLLDLPPAAQVLGELVVAAAESAEVDDLLQPRRGGRLAEVGGGLGVEPGEVR